MRYFIITILFLLHPPYLIAQSQASKQLSSQILELHQEGKLDSAILLTKNGIKLSEKENNNISLIKLHQTLASFQLLKYDLEEAQKSLDFSKTLLETLLKNTEPDSVTHELYAYNFDRLGMLESYKKNAQKSLEYRKKAAEYADSKYVGNLNIKANCQNGLGNAYIDNNMPSKALEAFEKATQYRNEYTAINKEQDKELRKEQRLLIAQYKNNIGVCHELLEDFDKSLYFYQEAYDIRKKALPEDHPSIAESLYNLTFVYAHKGYYEKAFAYNKKSLDILKKQYGENHPEMIDILNTMGKNKLNLGDIGQAQVYFEEALNIHHSVFGAKMSNDIAEVYLNIGEVELLKENPEAALINLDKCLIHWQDYPLKQSNVLTHTATAYALLEEEEAAIEAHNKSISTLENKENHLHSYASAMLNKARYLIERNQVREALPLLEKSKIILENGDVIQASMLADVYLLLAEAKIEHEVLFKDYLQQAKAICLVSSKETELSQLVFEDEYIKSFELEGDFYALGDKDLQKAIDKYNAALSISFERRRKYESEGSKSMQTKESRKIINKILACYQQLDTNEKSIRNAVFKIIEKAKSQALKENIRGLRNDRFSGIPRNLTREEHKLQVELDYWKKELYYQLENRAEDSIVASTKTKIFNFNTALESLQADIKQGYPDYYKLKYVTEAHDIETIQSVLATDESLIQYYMQDSLLYILLVNAENSSFHTRKISKDWSVLPSKILDAIHKKNNAAFIRSSRQLHAVLLGDLALKKNLIIIPDESLNILPFDLLLSSTVEANAALKSWPFALKKHNITKHYSSDLFYEERLYQDATEKNLISIAPDYDSTAYAVLPFAKEEAESIAVLMEGDALIGEKATSRSFWSKIRLYNIVHLASHAVLDDQNPLYSKLVFSPQKDRENFIHTADLYRFNLQAQMVALSACNTGAGRLQKGEGAISLARGFAYAGCPSILMSNWKAHDESSKTIMQSFYTYLKEGLSKSQALNLAKQDFLNNANTIYAAPLYWGGFEIIGNNQALLATSPFYLKSHFILAVLLFLIPLFYLLYRKFT